MLMTLTPCDLRRPIAAADISAIRTCTTTRPPRWRTRLPAPELGKLNAAACAELDADFNGSRDSASNRADNLPPLIPTCRKLGPDTNAVADAVSGPVCLATAAAGLLLT